MNSSQFKVSKFPIELEITDFDSERLIVVGDVHGCIEELAAVIKHVDPTPRDTVVFLGDLLDRGPASVEVAETIHALCLDRPQTHCVLGNHEEKHIRYRQWKYLFQETGQKNKMTLHPAMKTVHDGLSDTVILWMAGLPSVIKLLHGHVDPNRPSSITLMTHAGLLPGDYLRQQTKGLVRNRYVKASEKGWSPANMGRDWAKPEGAVLWDEAWTGGRVIYGHIVHGMEKHRVKNDCWGIDTGVCLGGRLTAYVEDLRNGEVDITQVKAKQVYFKNVEEE